MAGVVVIGAAIFFIALHRPQPAPVLKNVSTGEQWWTHEQRPTPVPTPRALPTPQLRPVIIHAPVGAPTAQARPTPCQICMEREMRYQRAIETGMGRDTGNTHTIPQIIHPPIPSAVAYVP